MGASGSSITSSRTSTSSSTSDRRPDPLRAAFAVLRLTHPFPSLLDGAVVAAVAVLAGGDAATAARLGWSMTALQAAIGTVNDLIDAPADAGRKPGKPIPAGLIPARAARVLALAAATLGLALTLPSGIGLLVLAVVVLAIGLAYDRWAKGTAWSWLPFAVGIPILPMYGWYGTTGALPPGFAVLLPAAVLAGAGLAIANARVDLERDRAAGTSSVAVHLGSERSWWVSIAVLAAAAAVLIGLTPDLGALVWLGLAVTAAGALRSWRATPIGREHGWRLQAIGVGIVGVGWVAGTLT